MYSNHRPLRATNMLINTNSAGIGLRALHYRELQTLTQTQTAADRPLPGFLEIHSENFFSDGGQPLAYLDWFAEHYPISMHGVGLSLGSADPIDGQHLAKLKRLIDRFSPVLVSEHLCWVGVDGVFSNDLLPIVNSPATLAAAAAKISEVQDKLGRPIMIENLSSYLTYTRSSIPEWEFMAKLSKTAGCLLLLDVNNIYINSVNHQFDAYEYLNAIAIGSVGEIHLAGFQDIGTMLIDTHGAPVSDEVWALYAHALARFGQVPTLLEWDTDIPALSVLLDEAAYASAMLAKYANNVRLNPAN